MAEKTLKSELAKIGWEGFAGWRAKELLDYYRRVRFVYGSWQGAIKNSAKIGKLRRNRMLVKAVGKGFADAIQVEFDLACNTKVEMFPDYYEPNYGQAYRFRELKPRDFFAREVNALIPAEIAGVDYDDYAVLPTKFGDTKNNRMVAGYLAEKDTVYVSKVWKRTP